VVFNHTAEGDATGPTFCYRGIANTDYYLLSNDASQYADYTGCFNTLNANNPVVRRLIRHSLRYWVEHMHVDGFRFDLASVLSRDENGDPMTSPPILWDIDTDPVLAGTKLIAEAWDAAGLYQVGSFVADNWQEWNGRFRDDIRHFLKGDAGMVPSVTQRLIGSPDIYGYENREAEASINFISCHDGFTLADLVAYNSKHNGANGEDNCDGSNDNISWNCGVEGLTNDPNVLDLRLRQRRNFLVMLLLSSGTPMLGMGDEVGRTQGGNNNAYCQDNALSWFNWEQLDSPTDLRRFVSELIAYRMHRDEVEYQNVLTLSELIEQEDIVWHGVILNEPDWGQESRSFAVTLTSLRRRTRVHLMANAWWNSLSFELPPADTDKHPWCSWIDTAMSSPFDILSVNNLTPVSDRNCLVNPRSIKVLMQRLR
jgi:glycogen operon protein